MAVSRLSLESDWVASEDQSSKWGWSPGVRDIGTNSKALWEEQRRILKLITNSWAARIAGYGSLCVTFLMPVVKFLKRQCKKGREGGRKDGWVLAYSSRV